MIEAEALTHGDFNADIQRLHLTYAESNEGAHDTLIAKLPTANLDLNDRAAIFQPGAREHWFYQQAAAPTPVRTPRCFSAEIESTSKQSILLLEHITLPSGDSRPGASESMAQAVVKSLVQQHVRWWSVAHHPVIQNLKSLLAPNLGEEEDLVGQLYDRAWPWFLEQGLFDLSADARKFGQALTGQIKWVDAQIRPRHSTLVHGDFKLENMHICTDHAQVIVLDWEDVFFGPGMINLTWFLAGCLTDESGEVEQRLLQNYHRGLLDGGVEDYPWEECYDDYRAAMCASFMQGVLTGMISAEADEEARERARPIGRRFCAAADRLNLLDRLDV